MKHASRLDLAPQGFCGSRKLPSCRRPEGLQTRSRHHAEMSLPPSKNTILLAPVPRRMSALTRQKSTLFQWLAVPLWVPTGKDSVPTDSRHCVRVLLDPAARLELGARWVNS